MSAELCNFLVNILVAGGFGLGLAGAVFHFFPAMIDRAKVDALRARLVAKGTDVRRFDESWAEIDSRLPKCGRLSVLAGVLMITAGGLVWLCTR